MLTSRTLRPIFCLAALTALGSADAPAAPSSASPVAGAPSTRPESSKLTLQDAIALARRGNPELLAARESRDAARGRIAEARGQRLPQISAGATYTYQGPVSTFTIAQEGQPPREIELNRTTTRLLRATATLSTDLAGRLQSQQRIARSGAGAADGNARATENDLVFSVTSAYAGVLRAQELVRVRREAVTASREQLRVAEAQFRAGVVPQFDVLRASVQVENLRQEQIAAENNRRTTEARLVAILNVDPTTRLELTPLVPPPAPGAAPEKPVAPASAPAPEPRRAAVRRVAREAVNDAPGAKPPVPPAPTPEPLILGEGPLPGLEEALAEAYRQRPEVLSAQENLRGAEERVRFERKGGLPDVNIQANYSFNPDVSGFSAEKSNYSVAANLNIPIFTGGVVRARVRSAKDEADATRARMVQVRQSIALDARTAMLNLREAQARRATAAANVNQAREALRIARVRYQAGASTAVEVTDAEVALTQSQTNQVNADYDAIVAQADLDRALGRTRS